MAPNNLKPGRTGRPSLSDEEKQILFDALSALTPRTKEFRQRRRELALRFSRTERSIDLNYEALTKKGRGPVSPSGPVTAAGVDPAKEV